MTSSQDPTPTHSADDAYPTRPGNDVIRRWVPRGLLLLAAYALGATWTLDQNVDALAAALPGWNAVQTGSLNLERFAELNPWIVPGESGAFSNRPVGLIALAYLAFLPVPLFTDNFVGAPATLVALLTTAAASLIVARLTEITISRKAGTFVYLALGFGSATWPISSSQLWPHGPDQLWLALIMWGVARDRPFLAGFASAVAVVTRPPLAVIPAVVALLLVWHHRRATSVSLALVAGTGLGTLLVLGYNRAIFGVASLSGGYGDLVGASSSYRTASGYITNLAGTLFDPLHGLFIWSAWLIACLLGLRAAWSQANEWMRAFAVAGIAYLLVHTALNRYWGGLAFNYRYGIEPLTVAMPLLAVAWGLARDRFRVLRLAIIGTLIFAVVLQGTDALLSGCETDGDVAQCSIVKL